MNHPLPDAIRMAAESCVARCQISKTPFISLREFSAKLALMGWDRESIREVESRVLAELTSASGISPGGVRSSSGATDASILPG